MAFNDTIVQLGSLLTKAVDDLGKVHKGNKSAAQRVRVRTIDIEKIAKKFRKESVAVEKKRLNSGKRRRAKKSRRRPLYQRTAK